MAILKKVMGRYQNTDAIDNLVRYILNPEKMKHMIYGGKGVYLDNIAGSIELAQQMFCVEGCRAEHYVLSFADHEAINLTVKNLMMLGYSVCDYFDDRQVVFGCHEAKDACDMDTGSNCGNVHIHFLISTCNIHTGKKSVLNYDKFHTFCFYTEALLEKMNISSERLIAIFH